MYELGFSEDLLNLSAGMPNMDTIAKIFLVKEDYFTVRAVLDAQLDVEEHMSPLDQDFIERAPQDKSFIVNMLPLTPGFDYAAPGDFKDNPLKPNPKELTQIELEQALNKALAGTINHTDMVFSVPENVYMRSLDSAVQGIKNSIIIDLGSMVGLMFPDGRPDAPELRNFIRTNYEEARAIPIVRAIDRYQELFEELQLRKDHLKTLLPANNWKSNKGLELDFDQILR